MLPGISTEQLRSRLNRMVADGMLTRQRYREVPPRVDYELTERARELMPILGELARWGYAWAWGTPRRREARRHRRDLPARPGSASIPCGSLNGTVELTVQNGDGDSVYQLIAGRRQRHRSRSGLPSSADARVIGTSRAWVKAFSPDGDRDGLELTGDRELANQLLDGLALASESSADADIRAA